MEYTWTTLICLSRIRNRGHSFRTKVVVVEDLVLHRFYWAIFKPVCCCISNNRTISFKQKFEKLLVWHLLVTIKTKRFFLCSFSVVPNSWSANNKQNVTLWFLLCLIILPICCGYPEENQVHLKNEFRKIHNLCLKSCIGYYMVLHRKLPRVTGLVGLILTFELFVVHNWNKYVLKFRADLICGRRKPQIFYWFYAWL